MIPSLNYGSVILLLLGLQYSAGPANILVATSVGESGFKSSIPLLIGLWIPAFAYLFLVAFGIQQFQSTYSHYFDGLTLLGIFYVFYLGYKFLKQQAKEKSNAGEGIAGFKDGFILAMLNGKLIASILTVFAIGLREDSSIFSIMVLIALFLITGITANILWGFGGKIFSNMMGTERLRTQNLIYGILLCGVALWMFYILGAKYI